MVDDCASRALARALEVVCAREKCVALRLSESATREERLEAEAEVVWAREKYREETGRCFVEDEKVEGLKELFEATQGYGWRRRDGWVGASQAFPYGALRHWYGVTVRDDGSISLDLSCDGLSGSLPKTLPQHLLTIDLSNNDLTGDVPIITETTLRLLDLSHNRLTGGNNRIPTHIQVVDLSNNCLTGPLLLESVDLLESLDLSVNFFSGPLPSISKQLRVLRLSDNCFQGSLVLNEDLCLEDLDLSHNALSGALPKRWPSTLRTLALSRNSFEGQIPNFDGCSFLTGLFLDSNHFSGQIPTFSSNIALTAINLSNNRLQGPIPVFDQLPNLERLDLSKNPGLYGNSNCHLLHSLIDFAGPDGPHSRSHGHSRRFHPDQPGREKIHVESS